MDGDYKIGDKNAVADAQLIINNIISGYDENATYVSSAEIKNDLEKTLVNTSSGGGVAVKQEITSTVEQTLGIQSTDRNGTLLDTLFMGQTTDTVQTAINSGTLGEGGKNLIKQVQGANTSINGVIYGNETFNEFCETRGLSYQDATNYIISLGSMDPSKVPPIDKELASSVRDLFEISDGNANKEITKNMMLAMEKSNEEVAAAQAYLRDLVITEVEGKKVIYVVNENAGVGYVDEASGEFIEIGTIGEGTKYIEGTAYTAVSYFNKEHYDGGLLIDYLEIMFPGYKISAEYESFLRIPPNPYPEDFGEQVTRIIQEIQEDYYSEGGLGENATKKIPLYGGRKPESILITTSNISGATTEIIVEVAASKEIHRVVDTMVFELQRFDGLPIMEEERAYTDSEIFASLYNMYFTPNVREKDLYSDSMFTILDLYMQLHAQTYGKVGMPPVTIEYKGDTAIYTLDFKTGLQQMASAAGVHYDDFVRNYFSSYTRPSYDEWLLDPSMHTYGFYPQETSTNYIPSLTQTNKQTGNTDHYYIGTVHNKSEIRGDALLTAQLFQNVGNMFRAVGNVGGIYEDKYLKTDSVRPVLLTLRPEISSVYNVHVYTTGTIIEDLPEYRNANTNTASEGKTWYFYPYREIFMSEGGRFNSSASYAEEWGPLSVGDNVVEAQAEQGRLALMNGSNQLVQNIIDTNNKQFSTGRGDIASYYNYVIYNGKNTSAMDASLGRLSENWINNSTRQSGDLTEQEKARIDASEGHLSLEDFQYKTYSTGGVTLQIPLDKNGQPLYNVSYGAVKCAYENGGSSTSWSDQQNTNSNFVNSLGSMYGTCTDEEIAGNLQSLGINIPSGSQFTYTNSSGQTVTTTPSGVLNTLMSEVAFGGKNAQDVAQEYGSLFGGSSDETTEGAEGGTEGSESTESSGGSSSAPRGPKHPCPEGVPDNCVYFAECCTRWFTASWNSMATVPYIVMDDVTPMNFNDSSLLTQPYESERIPINANKKDDSVFHWRWSQTLEGDPNGDQTTSFETTTGTIPVYDPLVEPTPSIQTNPNPNGNPYETTYRTTGGDLPPMPTPITIPPADDPNKGNIVIEQFISK